MLFSELLEFHKQILFGIHIAVKRFFLFMLLESFHLAVKLYLPSFGKTKSSFDANLLKILSSKSVRFYSSICFIRFSMNTADTVLSMSWSVWMDSNHRPRAYQARALTT